MKKHIPTIDRYQKITEILAKFKNGEELYKTNAMFNQSVQMMVEGLNEYEVLEQVILASERTQRAFEDYICRASGGPMSININYEKTP